MNHTILYTAVIFILISCGLEEGKKNSDFNFQEPPLNNIDSPTESDQIPEFRPDLDTDLPRDTTEWKAFQGMNTYCRSCHGVGKLRFFHSENPSAFFAALKTARSPKSQRLWIEAVIDVLNWPSADVPSFESRRSPQGDWMPLGAKRNHIANEKIDGVNAREFILKYLKELE